MRVVALAITVVMASACSQIAQTAVSVATSVVTQGDAQAYLDSYAAEFQRLSYASSLAEWESNTRIVAGDSSNAVRTKAANEASARFVGSVANIERIRGFLAHKDRLTPLQVRQLEAMLYAAANQPATVPDIVRRRIAAETEQTEKLYGYTFMVGGKAVTPNQIDSTLRNSTNMADRRAYWESSKAIGPTLKPGIMNLRNLRNQTVRALGYPDFFTYQVSDYEMTTDEMLRMNDDLLRQIRPLYRELHTWARYELAKRYNLPVPEYLPAHWLSNRWGQNWSDLATASGGPSLNDAFMGKTSEWVVRSSEDFYKSLGFPALPASFYEKSSLYPLPADAPYKKNTHASAWHLDLENDLRSLMSVEPNSYWWETSHHELGHIYYYVAYSRPEVPLVLRGGANRAYHEAIGSMIGLASMQRPFLVGRGLLAANAQADERAQLLREALNFVVFMPWSAGVMTRFEHELYANELPADQWNARWWELARRYQGIVPPAARGEQFADALTKTHINDDPAQYYDYALSFALLFQMHNHIAKNILHQDPRNTNYYGNTGVGDFLRTLMAP
ncbi:MAG: M2 family metallopeptidase, partial [Gemmatimonadaceae bacterium]|nr:M2 family metallopeptidase [Gemmatimonadaceae bacterium]